MSKLDHPYFGALDTGRLQTGAGDIWEASFTLHGKAFEVMLWAAPNMALDLAMLDRFAAYLMDLPSLDAQARAYLSQYLAQDRFYMEFHVEALPHTPVIGALAPDGDPAKVDADAFVAAMTLNAMRLQLHDPDIAIVMDYMIDPSVSNQIQAVKLAADGRLVTIAWES